MFSALTGTLLVSVDDKLVSILPYHRKTKVFDDFVLEQVKGIEPSCSAWEADILPLNYTCTHLKLLHYTTSERSLQEEI